MSEDLYTLIGYQVEVTADWRRRQAEYLPHDERNARAAKERERLAVEVISWKARQSTSRFASPLTA
jgi:hypothetical protein